ANTKDRIPFKEKSVSELVGQALGFLTPVMVCSWISYLLSIFVVKKASSLVVFQYFIQISSIAKFFLVGPIIGFCSVFLSIIILRATKVTPGILSVFLYALWGFSILSFAS
ncbi:MAG: hypothetical protein AAFP20_24060, partial [Cyanobacteria bacterium J06614_10]